MGYTAAINLTTQTVSSHTKSKNPRFIDLFAGLGGFHVGLSRLSMECVFACELDQNLRGLYKQNYGFLPHGDIRDIVANSVPQHDILCAGFPCQPFSIAGKKKGAECPASGKLIDDVLRIATYHLPTFIMLENVPNILTIEKGKFWNKIINSFGELGYSIDYRIYSPHQFGIPQKRNRIFVVMSRHGLDNFNWPEHDKVVVRTLNDIVISTHEDVRQIEPLKLRCLEKWQEFTENMSGINSNTIVASEFGATYPLDGLKRYSLKKIKQFRGAFGKELTSCKTWDEVLSNMPNYVQKSGGNIPNWLQRSVVYSRNIYKQQQNYLDGWKSDIVDVPNSWQKLEWRGVSDKSSIWQNTIQFRASGIRIMKPDCAPSLVAMTPTQTPIIGSRRRYMTVREAASLQSLESLKEFPENNANAFKALGNAVNAFIVGEIAKNLICK